MGKRAGSVVQGLLVLVGVAAAGCAHQPGTSQVPEIALRRGAAWSTISVAPPHITGPSMNLVVDGNNLRGFVGPGAIDVKVEGNHASGFGPSGPVNLTLSQQGSELLVNGMWNGGPAHLEIGPGLVRGSVIRRGSRMLGAEATCAYDLHDPRPSGALSGTSTCLGMPQDTRLEIDPRVRQQLSTPELSVVLVAMLGSPPLDVPAERIGG